MNCARKVLRSERKAERRSRALSFLEAFSSDLARSVYWSRVREKAVREAEIWPRREGVGCCAGEVVVGEELEERERSRFREVDCLRAVLKRVF